MERTFQLNEQVTIGGQPSPDDLKQIRAAGFNTVVNFRSHGEQKGQLPPDEEGDLVEELGMHYFHLPTSVRSMTREALDRFRAAWNELPRPVYAHCTTGKRAAAMVMIQMARQQDKTADEMLDLAKRCGMSNDKPELVQFVKNNVR